MLIEFMFVLPSEVYVKLPTRQVHGASAAALSHLGE